MSLPPLILCEDGTITQDPDSCRPRDTLDGERRLRLSKRVSGILRHFPTKYGLEVDSGGWVDLKALVKALQSDPQFTWVKEWHIRAIALTDPRGRFELREGRIRARYGHSIRVKVEPLPGPIPPLLYHATPLSNLPKIMKEGLKPGKRTHVHLTDDPELALEIGRRHSPQVALLKISTPCLERLGVKVEKRAPHIYLAERVYRECLEDERL